VSAAAATLSHAGPPLRLRQRRIERLTGWGFALPAFVLLLLVNLAPLVVLLILSFTDYQLGAISTKFVGLDNFTTAFGDATVRRAFGNTFLYVLIVLPGAVIGALVVAVLVHARKRSRWVYEIIYFLPVTSTLIAMATVWQFLLHPELGPVDAFLRLLHLPSIAFLSDPRWALPTLAVIGIWQLIGFNMVLFLAGLSAIPRDLYEAAEIDGCVNGLDRFFTITLPLLGPTLMFVLITTSITAFKIFDTVAVLTRGNPMGTTDVLLYDIYLEGFQYFHTGYASALTVLFLVVILIFSAIQAYLVDRRVHYG
jgi:multiple sugar transport system permease protein